MTTHILFDLDATLLPMEQTAFLGGYFRSLAAFMAPHGFDPNALIAGVNAGVASMLANDGAKTNEKAFWNAFQDALPSRDLAADMPLFEDYYKTVFPTLRRFSFENPLISPTINALSRKYRLVLATNPVFPRIAVEERLRWANIDPTLFDLITTYENIGFAKPNPSYFTEIAARLGIRPCDCLMVGNDVSDDILPAIAAGMETYLITDCLINEKNYDISALQKGDFATFAAKFVDLHK